MAVITAIRNMKQIRWRFLLLIITAANAATAQPGSLDLGFGNNGKVVENAGFSTIRNNATILQSDGKILVLATAVVNGVDKTIILRYLGNGIPDPGFGTNGKVTILENDNIDNCGTDIHLQADGRILVSGTIKKTVGNPFLFRLNTTGSFDSSFNGNGQLVFDEGEAAVCSRFVVLPGNSIVAVLQYAGFADGNFRALQTKSQR